MEVLGIVGAVAGLATNAVQLTQAIRDLISGIKSAPKNLIRLGEELNVLQMVLSEASNNCAIRGDSNEKGMAIMALQDCVKELEQVYERVKPWQQKARESRGISIASFQMHREEKELKAVLEGLERRKMTICMALMVSISSTRSRFVWVL
jgi:hypothetical protein